MYLSTTSRGTKVSFGLLTNIYVRIYSKKIFGEFLPMGIDISTGLEKFPASLLQVYWRGPQSVSRSQGRWILYICSQPCLTFYCSSTLFGLTSSVWFRCPQVFLRFKDGGGRQRKEDRCREIKKDWNRYLSLMTLLDKRSKLV